MRILHIDTGAGMRGGQYQVLLLMNGLRDAGHDSVLLARDGGPLGKAASAAGFTVYPATLQQVWRRSAEVALVHAHDARAHSLAAVASRRKFVVARRVAFSLRRSFASVWKYRRAARFLAVSRFVADELTAGGIGSEKIDVVYDGVEPDVVPASSNPDSPAVALASRDPEKGRDLVEQAVTLSRIPVVFSSDLKKDLRAASMLVYITRSEGLGSATLLAMSMGVPVIASRIGGLQEVFSDGESGLFVENTAPAVAEAMRRLANDPGLAAKLRVGGQRRVAEHFTQEHLIRATLASYERVLAG